MRVLLQQCVFMLLRVIVCLFQPTFSVEILTQVQLNHHVHSLSQHRLKELALLAVGQPNFVLHRCCLYRNLSLSLPSLLLFLAHEGCPKPCKKLKPFTCYFLQFPRLLSSIYISPTTLSKIFYPTIVQFLLACLLASRYQSTCLIPSAHKNQSQLRELKKT